MALARINGQMVAIAAAVGLELVMTEQRQICVESALG
jgi:hypothetical protein